MYLVKFEKENRMIFSELLPFFDILDIANAISRKILVFKALNFYQLIEYLVKIVKKKHMIFICYYPLKILTSQFCKSNISKSIIAKDLKPMSADK